MTVRRCGGTFDANFGVGFAGGSQVFAGFTPQSEVDASRDNIGIYADAEWEPNAQTLISAAVRFEDYSDFGDTFTGKLTGRYDFNDTIAVRGAGSTGFRAPSLQQQFFTASSTNFIDGVPFEIGILIGMAIVFVYAVLGGMKGITYTQVAQYVVLIFAYTVPAIFISLIITGNPVPQLGFISNVRGEDISMIAKLNTVLTDLGFMEYTSTNKSMMDVFAITGALMFGTAGLPHVIIRFFTVSSAKNARVSAGWALIFIALLYTTAPAVGAFARLNFIDQVHNKQVEELPAWYGSWSETGLLGYEDKNGDGKVQYFGDKGVDYGNGKIGDGSKQHPDSEATPLNRDIFVLANPEIAQLPGWVIGLVVAGGLAAALSTAAGLLMVISSAISHDLCRRTIWTDMDDKTELRVARGAAAGAVVAAGLLGIFSSQLGFVAQVVAFAFGLASASLFPVIFLGIFWKRMNKEGAIVAMLFGLISTFAYIVYFKFGGGTPDQFWFGVSPEGIGFVFMWVSSALGIGVSLATSAPPQDIQDLVEDIRVPGTRQPHGIADADMAPSSAE